MGDFALVIGAWSLVIRRKMSMTHTQVCGRPVTAAATQRRSQWLYHGTWLVIPALAIGLSLVLEIRNEREVLMPVLNQPLPELCSFRRMTGLDCAGCGLTRSFISIGHGRIADAWHYHPAGLLLYAIAAFQIPWQSVQLWRMSVGATELQTGKFANSVFYILAVLLLGVWIVRLGARIAGM
jgi:uncharacterized protein DUF2752